MSISNANRNYSTMDGQQRHRNGPKTLAQQDRQMYVHQVSRHDPADDKPRRLWQQYALIRIKEFTWTFFTMTMATGGIANVLFRVPFYFPGLFAIGCTFFILNIALFIFNMIMISLRFYFDPGSFRRSFLHPTECLFVPASIVSVGTILLGVSEYGVASGKTGYWLLETMHVLFWVYCAGALILSCLVYLIMWSTQAFTLENMTPIWIFPAYPLLVIGPHAAILTSLLSSEKAIVVAVGAVVLQGIGFMLSTMIYAAFLSRLMVHKLPEEGLKPGMFVSVGPAGFTTSGLVGMGLNMPRIAPAAFMGDGELAGKVSKILAVWVGLWLWGLAFWFFAVSVGAHWSVVKHVRPKFSMTFYSYIFPVTALTTATFALGRALDLFPLQVVGCVLAILLVIGWIVVFVAMIRAVVVKDLLWPQSQT